MSIRSSVAGRRERPNTALARRSTGKSGTVRNQPGHRYQSAPRRPSDRRAEGAPMNFTLASKTFAPLAGVHAGTGTLTNSAHVVVPASVDTDVSAQLDFAFSSYNIEVLSFETGAAEAP